MHDWTLSRQHVQARKDGLFSTEELDVEHGSGVLWEIFYILDAAQILLHLLRCHLNQIVHLRDFLFQLLDHSLKWVRSILAIFGEREDLALEGLAHSCDSIPHLQSILVDQHVHSLGLLAAVKVFESKIFVMESRQYFATWRSENEFLEGALLRAVYGSGDVGDRDTSLTHALAAIVSFVI